MEIFISLVLGTILGYILATTQMITLLWERVIDWRVRNNRRSAPWYKKTLVMVITTMVIVAHPKRVYQEWKRLKKPVPRPVTPKLRPVNEWGKPFDENRNAES